MRFSRGVALVAVLWLVAALSVMLIGLQHVVRGEIRMAGQSRNALLGANIADAALLLTLQSLDASKTASYKSIQVLKTLVFDHEVNLQIRPLNGLIDLNNAPLSLLADAFEFAGGAPQGEALRLANEVVEARERKSLDGSPQRFHAVEDLLRLPSMEYDTYAKMGGVLTADVGSGSTGNTGNGRVNPLAASLDTLAVLTKGDRTRAQQLVEARQLAPESMDATTLTATHISMDPSSYLSIQAAVALQSDVTVLRTVLIDMATPSRGLPWRVLRIEPVVTISTLPVPALLAQ